MTIEILNLRNTQPSEPYDFKVDRTTPLGNMFRMVDESDRETVCDDFDYNFPRISINKEPSEYLHQIINIYRKYGIVRLFCWCVPKRCHAFTIKNYIEELFR